MWTKYCKNSMSQPTAFVVSLNKNQQEPWTGRETELPLEDNLAVCGSPSLCHPAHFLLYQKGAGDLSGWDQAVWFCLDLGVAARCFGCSPLPSTAAQAEVWNQHRLKLGIPCRITLCLTTSEKEHTSASLSFSPFPKPAPPLPPCLLRKDVIMVPRTPRC